MATLECFHCLTSTSAKFDLFTDHKTLIFIYDPLSLNLYLSQSSIPKVLR